MESRSLRSHSREVETDELMIALFNYRLIKCPTCLYHFDSEEDCFEHVLDHFENSQNFLLQRINLVFWFKKYITKGKEEPSLDVLTVEKDENMNDVEKHENSANDDVKPCIYTCKVCNGIFLTEHLLAVHSFIHVQILLPAVNSQLKCPLCEKYFCTEESCLFHIYSHLQVTTNHKKGSLVLKWFSLLFTSTPGGEILSKYDEYASKLDSPLLSKILVSEVTKAKACKYCNKPISSIFDSLDNHRNCNSTTPISQSFICVMCNFDALNSDLLMKHFFLKHVACYCGFHGKNFASFQQHSVNCAANRNGVLCPICRASKFTTVEAFKEHIQENGRRCCSKILKKNKWKCLICKVQSSQKEMPNHILSEHVNCMCNYKTNDFNSFCIHTSKCAIKKKVLLCPICGLVKCSTEKYLKEHMTKCLPWQNSEDFSKDETTIFGSVKISNIQGLLQCHNGEDFSTCMGLKRKRESVLLELPTKRRKLDIM